MSLKAMFIHFRTFHFKFMLSCNFVFRTFHVHNSFVYHHRTCVHIYVHNMYIWGFELATVSITSPCPFIHSKLCLFQVYVIPRKITYKYYQHQCAATQASIHINLYANYSIQNWVWIMTTNHVLSNFQWNTWSNIPTSMGRTRFTLNVQTAFFFFFLVHLINHLLRCQLPYLWFPKSFATYPGVQTKRNFPALTWKSQHFTMFQV